MELDEQPYLYARLTQLGECLPYKEKVGGSSPSSSTNKAHYRDGYCLMFRSIIGVPFICQINRSGLRTCLENNGYGDEPYGDRHLSLAPMIIKNLTFYQKFGKI